MVRPVAIGRRNYLFMGSNNGGKAAAVLYCIMASAKANEVEPFIYVRDLLTQLSCNTSPAAGGAASRRLVDSPPGSSPVLVAIGRRSDPATPRS
jgi:hypothetical protein